MLLEHFHLQTGSGQHKGIASQAAGGIPDFRFGGVVHRFGNQFAAAFCAPIMSGSAGKIGTHRTFFTGFAQSNTVRIGLQIQSRIRYLCCFRQTALVNNGLYGSANVVGTINRNHL